MKADALPWPTKNPRARAEWDFRTPWKGYDVKNYDAAKYGSFEFLPVGEIEYCDEYEMTRSDPDYISRMQKWRKGCPQQTFDALLTHYARTRKHQFSSIAAWLCRTWPEWPQLPYLSIDPAERRRRLKLSHALEQEAPPTLETLSIWDVIKRIPKIFRRNKKSIIAAREALGLSTYEIPRVEGETITIQGDDPIDGGKYQGVIAAIKVDLNLSNKELAERFVNWCDEQRRKRKWKANEHRGPRSNSEKTRKVLINLGAWRLVKTGLTQPKAIQFTQKASGKPLYAQPPAWSNATTSFDQYLQKFNIECGK